MPDQFTEITNKSWGSKLKDSIAGVGMGFIMIVLSPFLLCWNESNYVDTKKGIAEVQSEYKVIQDIGSVNASLAGKAVYISGEATTDEMLNDPELSISVKAIHLLRKVEMYQWQEKKTEKEEKKVGGGTEIVTTYSYEKVWSENLIDSNQFHPKGKVDHQNPPQIPVKGATISAKNVRIGAYALSPSLINSISTAEPFGVTDANTASLSPYLKANAKAMGNVIYVGKDPNSAQVGDIRISVSVVKPQVVSIISKLVGNTFEPYKTKSGINFERLTPGTASADNMLAAAKSESVMVVWILRLIGFLMMMFGIKLIFGPLEKLGDVLPFLGTIIGFGSGLVAFIIALPVSIIIIAISWIIFRPLVGILLLLVAAGSFAGIYYWKKKKAAA